MFGQLVRDHRLRLGLSQAEVADRTGLGERGLRNIETGRITKPRPVTVRLLADAFELQGEERDRFCAAGLTDRDAAAYPSAPPPPAAGVPAQLPAALAGFTGRADSLAALARVLERGGATMLTVAITGTAGVGKTTLAVHWAHHVKHRYPDGQLYVNLRGFDPDAGLVPAAEALGGFLAALGVPEHSVPADLAERAATFRSLVAGRQLLVVLDNARDAEHVRPMLPGTAGCLVVVTSRNQLTSLVAVEGAHPLPLTVLGDDEARSLIAARIGLERAGAEPEAMADIVARCAQLPLALSVVAARAAIQPDTPLAALAAELRRTDGALDALDGGDAVTNVRAVFSWSYRALTPDARRMFRLLGVHPGADVDLFGAAATAALPVPTAKAALGELVRANLLREHRPGRYAFHDLLRAYAADQTDAAEADAAQDRLLDHYLYTAFVAVNLIFPVDTHTRPHVTAPDTATPDLTDVDAARRWLDGEHHNLIAATAHAAAHRWPEHAVNFSRTLYRYIDGTGRYGDAVLLHGHARDAADRLGEAPLRGRAHRNLGNSYLRQQLHGQAAECYREALAAFVEAGDEVGQAFVECDLAANAMYTGDGPEAVVRFERALHFFRTRDHTYSLGVASMNIAEAYEMVGDYAAAVEHLGHAITIFRTAEDKQLEAVSRNNLGGIYRRLGRYDESAGEHLAALSLHQERNNSGGEINWVRNDLARLYVTTGKLRQAADYTHLALSDSRANGDRRTEGFALVTQGLIDLESGRTAAALAALREAVAIFATTKDKAGQAYAHNALGAALRRAGNPAAARAEHAAGLTLSTEVGDRYEQAFAHDGLGHAAQATGDDDAAVRHWSAALDRASQLGIPLADEVRRRLDGAPVRP